MRCEDCKKVRAETVCHGARVCLCCAAKRRVLALGIAGLPVRRDVRAALECRP